MSEQPATTELDQLTELCATRENLRATLETLEIGYERFEALSALNVATVKLADAMPGLLAMVEAARRLLNDTPATDYLCCLSSYDEELLSFLLESS